MEFPPQFLLQVFQAIPDQMDKNDGFILGERIASAVIWILFEGRVDFMGRDMEVPPLYGQDWGIRGLGNRIYANLSRSMNLDYNSNVFYVTLSCLWTLNA